MPMLIAAASAQAPTAPTAPAQSAPSTKRPPPPMPVIDKEAVVRLVDELGHRAVDRQGVPGLTIAVAKDGEMLAAKGFGAVGPGGAGGAGGTKKTPVTADTAWPIGSLTRQFTAVAALELVDAQKIAEDDGIGKLLPKLLEQAPKIPRFTLHQLLANTAGVPSWHGLIEPVDGHVPDPKAFSDERAFLAQFGHARWEFEPGTGFSLDTTGYALLATIVARVSGEPYPVYVKKHLLEKVGLRSTDFFPAGPRFTNDFAASCEVIYALEEELELPFETIPASSTQCLRSTAADLVKWEDALFDRAVFSERSSRAMITPTKLPDGNSTNYGYAMGMSKLGEYKCYAHTGIGSGVRSRVAFYPLPHVTIVVLACCENSPVVNIEHALARLVLNLPAPEVKRAVLGKEDARRCSGKYSIGALSAAVDADGDGLLLLTLPGERQVGLLHRGSLVFVPEDDDDARITFDARDGQVVSFTLERGSFTTVAKRSH